MPFVNSPVTNDVLTADGDANGYVTVASNENYFPGARAWLSDSAATAPVEYIVTDLVGTTKVGLRQVPTFGLNAQGPSYGRTPVTQWTAANTAKISQEATVVRVELSNISKVSLV